MRLLIPATPQAWRQLRVCSALACSLAGLLIAAPARAQSTAQSPAQAAAQAADSPIEVVAGDSFSAIAGRILGSPRHWARLYDARLSGLPDPTRIAVGQRFELVTGAGGARYLRLVGSQPLPAAPSAAPAPVAAAPTPAAETGSNTLVIGVLPNIASATLQAQYDHLSGWLERTQGVKARISVPANFKVFFDNTMRGDYDLAVAAPHFARVALADRGMLPVMLYEPRISALFIARPDDGINAPADVRGKALGFANPTSLVALYGLQWFRQAGLEPGKDFEVRGARTDMGVGRLLLADEVAGVVMSNGEFRALPQDESARLRTVTSFARIPNFIIVAHPRLGAARIARLKTQLKAFIADPAEGAAFVKATGITGMADVDDAVLRELDPFTQPTRRAMGLTH